MRIKNYTYLLFLPTIENWFFFIFTMFFIWNITYGYITKTTKNNSSFWGTQLQIHYDVWGYGNLLGVYLPKIDGVAYIAIHDVYVWIIAYKNCEVTQQGQPIQASAHSEWMKGKKGKYENGSTLRFSERVINEWQHRDKSEILFNIENVLPRFICMLLKYNEIIFHVHLWRKHATKIVFVKIVVENGDLRPVCVHAVNFV